MYVVNNYYGQERDQRRRPNPRDFPPDDWFLTQFADVSPWNVTPRSATESAGDKNLEQKLFPKFGGKVEDYIPWRNIIIPGVHQAYAPITSKFACLIRTIDTDAASMRFVVPIKENGPEAYYQLVHELEARFGGQENSLKIHRQIFDRFQTIKVRDERGLQELIAMTTNYIDALHDAGRGPLVDQVDFYERLALKLPLPYREAYQDWYTDRYATEECTALSLLDWCRAQVVKIRRADLNSGINVLEEPRVRQTTRRTAGTANAATSAINACHDDDGETVQELPNYVSAAMDVPKENDTSVKQVAESGETTAKKEAWKRKPCLVCQSDHGLWQCEKFGEMNTEERRAVVYTNRLCYRCLRLGHPVIRCRLQSVKCDRCPKRHHPLIHEVLEKATGPELAAYLATQLEDEGWGQEAEEDVGLNHIHVQLEENKKQKQALRIVPMLIRTSQGMVECNCLLDDGSMKTVIDEDTRAELRLDGKSIITRLSVVGGQVTDVQGVRTEIALYNLEGQFVRSIGALSVPNALGRLQPFDWNDAKGNWEHLKDVKFPSFNASGVSLLIGAPEADLMASLEEREAGPGAPVGRLTKLGWTALGPTYDHDPREDDEGNVCFFGKLAEVRKDVETGLLAFSQELKKEDPYSIKSYGYNQVKEANLRELIELVSRIHQLEERKFEFGMVASPEEQRVLEMLEARIKYLDIGNGKKKVELPCVWKPGCPKLVNNRKWALATQMRIEKSAKHRKYRKEYNEMMQQQFKLGYIKDVPIEEREEPLAYYLTHFGVLQPHKESTPIRGVFNGSGRSGDPPKSLNDDIAITPRNIMNDMVLVHHRERRNEFVVLADIKHMFLRISLSPEDRKYHRFFFRESEDEDWREIEWQVHCFGNAGSPCAAIFAIKQWAKENQGNRELASDMIINSTIVDDAADSFPTEEAATEAALDALEMLAEIDMDLRKFASNSRKVMEAIPKEKRAAGFDFSEGLEEVLPTIKVLGIRLNLETDNYEFRYEDLELIEDPAKWTTRQMLSTHPRVFDLMGFISPHIIAARLIFQDAFKQDNAGWDKQVSEIHGRLYADWIEETKKHLSKVLVARCLRPRFREIESVELHVFGDASGVAYCAVAYVRVEYRSGEVIIRFDWSKARVLPTKKPTTPRAELMAAVLAAEIAQPPIATLEPDRVVFWSDSMNVLCWLRNRTKEMQIYVANRVTKIQDLTEGHEWKHVPTLDNPADLGSRSKKLGELLETPLWWHGPEWLVRQEYEWPKEPKLQLSQEALKEAKRDSNLQQLWQKELEEIPVDCINHAGVCAFVVREPDLEHPIVKWESYGCWRKLVRIMGYARRFISNWCGYWRERIKNKEAIKPRRVIVNRIDYDSIRVLSPEELSSAETALLRVAQAEMYPETLKALAASQTVQDTDLLRYRPFLDGEGLMRVGARLNDSQKLESERRDPVILRRDHHLVQLVLKHLHVHQFHHVGGENALLAEFMKRFLMTKGRRIVRSFLRNCNVCKLYKCRPMSQEEANLPETRILDPEAPRLRAFEFTALDCAGPFAIRLQRSQAKRWLCIFVCMTFKAVHLEPLFLLEADSFVQAFNRFVRRKGCPNHVRSDNGTNLVAGAKFLRQNWRCLTDSLKKEYPEIKFSYAAPGAPWSNGIAERSVGLAKGALLKLADTTEKLNDEQFLTALVMAEGILNSRPITYVSDDPEDPRPLSPNHFIPDQLLRDLPPVMAEGEHGELVDSFKMVDQLMDRFWHHYVNEMIPQMHRLNSLTRPQENVKVGDVVAMLDKGRRGHWQLARVQEVFVDTRGRVRTCRVFNRHGEYLRPVRKLMLLVSDNSQ